MPGAAKRRANRSSLGVAHTKATPMRTTASPIAAWLIHRRRVTTVTMNTMITTMNSSKATGPEMIDVPELPPANHICAM